MSHGYSAPDKSAHLLNQQRPGASSSDPASVLKILKALHALPPPVPVIVPETCFEKATDSSPHKRESDPLVAVSRRAVTLGVDDPSSSPMAGSGSGNALSNATRRRSHSPFAFENSETHSDTEMDDYSDHNDLMDMGLRNTRYGNKSSAPPPQQQT